MTASTTLVTGTDFITVATQDFDAAVQFYGNVLGLPESKRWGQMPAAEFETGNLTIAVMQSDAFGLEFQANNHPIDGSRRSRSSLRSAAPNPVPTLPA
jgi:catechol 2,3-dioxygenase-like lactoylglutathione lyase family enzyme